MCVLIEGLPDGARSKTDDPGIAEWGTTDELLAQLVEEVSVLVADRRRKEPRTIPRPWEAKKSGPVAGVVVSEDGGMVATGLSGMLSATQRRGAVNLGV